MKILITGICGFVGSSLAEGLLKRIDGLKLTGIDNLSRPGSQTNVSVLRRLGVRFVHGDLRSASDLDACPEVDFVIDAAAQPSVLAGVDGRTTSRQLVEHNLLGTINTLEYARRCRAGLVLLSTSRVYSVAGLAAIPVSTAGGAFAYCAQAQSLLGVSELGINETFSTAPPISMYGATKLASEVLSLDYAAAYGFPVIVNRCGVMAGGGQFGTAEQGIFSYWIRAYANRQPLRYIGFDGTGRQVRDALHPDDLAELLTQQIRHPGRATGVWNVGGGRSRAMSLSQLSAWAATEFGEHSIEADPRPRPYDAPWIVMDASKVSHAFTWAPSRSILDILREIAEHHRQNPEWVALSTA